MAEYVANFGDSFLSFGEEGVLFCVWVKCVNIWQVYGVSSYLHLSVECVCLDVLHIGKSGVLKSCTVPVRVTTWVQMCECLFYEVGCL